MKLRSKQRRNGCRFYRYPTLFIPFITTLIILASLITFLLWPINAIKIYSGDNTIAIYTVDIYSEIYIDYTHSAIKTPVRDVFQFEGKKTLLLTRTEYGSFGAGLPTESFGELKLVDGVFINSGINMEFKEVPLRVGAIAKHKIAFEDGGKLELLDYVEAGSLVIIKPIRITRLQAFFIEGRTNNGQ